MENIKIQLNHYNETFNLTNNSIKSKDIIKKYYLDSVYLGNFYIELKKNSTLQAFEGEGKNRVYKDLEAGAQYICRVIEDDEAEKQRPNVIGYVAATNSVVNSKRKEGCSCLYGNPCMDPDACEDWNNRKEIAKKNGWKGY